MFALQQKPLNLKIQILQSRVLVSALPLQLLVQRQLDHPRTRTQTQSPFPTPFQPLPANPYFRFHHCRILRKFSLSYAGKSYRMADLGVK
jgi:hypothetical protein